MLSLDALRATIFVPAVITVACEAIIVNHPGVTVGLDPSDVTLLPVGCLARSAKQLM
jgi:hypothetical protein